MKKFLLFKIFFSWLFWTNLFFKHFFSTDAHASALAVHVATKSAALWRHSQNLFDPFPVSLSVCCICLSAWAALRQPHSPSLHLVSFLVSLCQLQHCPTYRCLPSMRLTACLKKINISVGGEAKASIWCVYLGGRRTPEHAAQWRVVPLFHLLLSLFHFTSLSPSLSFLILFFFCLNPCSSGGVRCVSGQVTGNDTTEQSLNFSHRAVPLILQVAVSFCRHCLNIVAVFNSHGPDIFFFSLRDPVLQRRQVVCSTASFCSWCMKCVKQSDCSHFWGSDEKNAVMSAVIWPQICAAVFFILRFCALQAQCGTINIADKWYDDN